MVRHAAMQYFALLGLAMGLLGMFLQALAKGF